MPPSNQPASARRPRLTPLTSGAAPWCRGRWLAWGVAPLLAMAGVGLAATLLWPSAQTLFLWFNHHAATLPAAGWSMLTLLGDTTVLLALLSPLLLWRPQALLAAVAAIPAGGLLSVLSKSAFNVPRPAAVLEPGQFHLIGPALHSHSFPSGHSLTAFAVACAVLSTTAPALRSTRAVLLLACGLLLATGIGASRVAVGAHWPLDVVFGAGLGWVAGLSGALLTRWRNGWWQSLRWQRLTGAVLAATGAWLLWRPLDYPLARPVLWLAAACATVTLTVQAWAAWRDRARQWPAAARMGA